jgi:hypothetical protein
MKNERKLTVNESLFTYGKLNQKKSVPIGIFGYTEIQRFKNGRK